MFTKTILTAATLATAVVSSQPAMAKDTQCRPEWTKCVCVSKPLGNGNLYCFNDKIAAAPGGGGAQTHQTGGMSFANDRQAPIQGFILKPVRR